MILSPGARAMIEGEVRPVADDRPASARTGLATVAGRATVELRRSGFVVDAGAQVYRVAPVAAVAALGVGVRF